MTVSPVSGALRRMTGVTPGGRLGRIAVAPAAVVEPRPALLPRSLAHLVELVLGGVAEIGAAGGEQSLGDLAMPRGACELIDGVAVPIDSEPVQSVEDGVDRRLGRALPIGVLDPQQDLAAPSTGVEPVEQAPSAPRRYAEIRSARGRSE